MTTAIQIKRALISVSDKRGLDLLAKSLAEKGVEILSTGGTAQFLRQLDIPVKDVSEETGFPEILGGRVKTLHPKIFGGILAKRNDPAHTEDMTRQALKGVDLVVVNLYPFEQVCAKTGVPDEELIENIDIGGNTLIRAAAKNFAHVTVVCDPDDYIPFLDDYKQTGSVRLELRQHLAAKAFRMTAHYDAVIAQTFLKSFDQVSFPTLFPIALRKKQDLRYGENPHQKAAVYGQAGYQDRGVLGARVLQGKELSYNNYLDIDAAWRLALSFTKTVCVIVKHNNPCGVAEGTKPADAYRKALACDPVSAFGGVVAFNGPVDGDTAREITKIFTECVIAPAFSDEARTLFSAKQNLRLLEQLDSILDDAEYDIRRVSGGVLVQSTDSTIINEIKLVTKREPTAEEKDSLLFAWRVAKHVKSNAIVLTRELQTYGIGAGQMSRVDALRVAVMKMNQATGLDSKSPLVLASDAFFPFRDTVDEAAKIGVTAVIQPGGSVKDADSIAAANEHNMAMLFTSIRHFKH